MPAPVTANTVLVTQQAQQVFEQNAEDLAQVRKAVDSVVSELTNTGMDPVSLDVLTSGLQLWNAALNDIINTSQWMAEMLADTWQQIQKNEQNNTDLADGLTVGAEPLMSRLPAIHPSGATVAPGQTVGMMVAVEERPALLASRVRAQTS